MRAPAPRTNAETRAELFVGFSDDRGLDVVV
jgi:hypothetical protein